MISSLEKIMTNKFVVQYLFTYALCAIGLFCKDIHFSRSNKCKIDIPNMLLNSIVASIVAWALHYVFGKKDDMPLWALESFVCGVWSREVTAILFSSRFAESLVKLIIGLVAGKIDMDDDTKDGLENDVIKELRDIEKSERQPQNKREVKDNKDPPNDG